MPDFREGGIPNKPSEYGHSSDYVSYDDFSSYIDNQF